MLLGVAGCNSAKPPSLRQTPVLVYADLNSLVKVNPAWPGVVAYNNALAVMKKAPGRLPKPVNGDASLNYLPGMAVVPVNAPAVELAEERTRLETLEHQQLNTLIARRAIARERQIARKRENWETDARQQFLIKVGEINADYAREYERLFQASDIRRLNLEIQIRSLDNLIANWQKQLANWQKQQAGTNHQPAPELMNTLASLSKERDIKRNALADFEAGNKVAVSELRSKRNMALSYAKNDQDVTVKNQVAEERAKLEALDAEQVIEDRNRLEAQLASVLKSGDRTGLLKPDIARISAERSEEVSMPAVSLSAAALTEEEHSLTVQKKRLSELLYDETRARANDVAALHDWTVIWSRPAFGGRDVTSQLAAILSHDVWFKDLGSTPALADRG